MLNAIFENEEFLSIYGLLFILLITVFSILLVYTLKFVIQSYIFKYDTKRRDSIIKSMSVFLAICYISMILAQFTGNSTVMIKAILVLLAFKILYHFTRNMLVELYGKEVDIEVEVTNKKVLEEINIQLEKKLLNSEEKVSKIEINKEYFYKTKEDKFYEKKVVHISTKATSLLEIVLLVFYSIFTATVIIDILEPIHNIFQSSFTIPAIAFLGAYVFNPAFSDIYAFVTFIKNKNIDLEKFIRFKDNGEIIKGRIISMNTSHLIIKDHVLGITKTVPNRELIGKIIDNLSNIENKLGIKHTLSYVVGYDLYKDDLGEELKKNFKTILSDFEAVNNDISKQDEYNIWLTSHNDGVNILLWYFVKDIEEEERIRLDIEDFILQEATKYNYDLRTPKLIEVIKT